MLLRRRRGRRAVCVVRSMGGRRLRCFTEGLRFRLGIGIDLLLVVMVLRHCFELAFRLLLAGGKRANSAERTDQKEPSNRFHSHGGEPSSLRRRRASPENAKTWNPKTRRRAPSAPGRYTTPSASPGRRSRTSRGKAAPAGPTTTPPGSPASGFPDLPLR